MGDYTARRTTQQHTLGHVDCPACHEARSSALEALSPALSFEEAARLFLRLRSVDATPGAVTARYVKRNTTKCYVRQTRSLELFFRGMSIGEIRWWHMRSYQEARSSGSEPFVRFRRPQDAFDSADGKRKARGKTPCPAKAAQVNQEMGFLKRLKILSLCWTAEDDRYYKPLLEEQCELQRALTPEEQVTWLEVSRARERWMPVHWYSIVAFDTMASVGELRQLRLGDVNLQHRLVNIPWPAAKNKYRHREIAIESADTLWALDRLLMRARDLGCRDPQHFLFPFQERRRPIDPSRPGSESFLKKLWNEVREASGLKWFRMADTRHTGATRLAEAGVDARIIARRMGHCGVKMQEHYIHLREQAERRWLRFAQQPRIAPPRFGPQPVSWHETAAAIGEGRRVNPFDY